MDKKIKSLVIIYFFWRNDTSIGYSYPNIISANYDRFEFVNIYFRYIMLENNLFSWYFHISEKRMIKNISLLPLPERRWIYEN